MASFGEDGWIRTWDVETIEAADPPETQWVMLLEPLQEMRLGKMSFPRYVIDTAELREAVSDADAEHHEPSSW